MIGLIAELFDGANWVEAGAIKTNVTGTPIDSATPNYDGSAIAGIYTLTFSSVVASTSAILHIAADSPANPYDGLTASVVLDGATPDTTIGGVSLLFSNSGSFTNSWSATVSVGLAFGILNAFPPDGGTPSDGIRVRVENTGSEDGTQCKATILQSLKFKKITGTVFAAMRTFAPEATENITAGQEVPYEIVVSAVAGVGAAKTMTVKIDGSNFDVQDLTTGTTTTSTGLGVVHYYRAVTGPLEGMEFLLSQSAVNSDEVNVLTFPNNFLQLAPDLITSAGDWGTDDITLTEDGQADGIITASGVAFFWARVLVPDAANSLSNPYICDVDIEGAAVAAAGWSN